MIRYTWRTAVREILLILFGIAFALPMYVLLNVAFRPADAKSSFLSLTLHPTFSNIAQAWRIAALGSGLISSVLITVVTVAGIVVVSALTAYPLARSFSKLSSATFFLVMSGLFLPLQLGMIPLYWDARSAGLLGTPIPLIILYIGLRLPFSTFLYVQFIRQLPSDYEEAAAVDGCSPIRAFRRVVFPLLRPVTGAIIIINAIFVWNDFLSPLIYLTGTRYQTLPIAAYGFVGQYGTQWTLIFGTLFVAATPLIIVYFFLQKKMISGFTSGLKG